MGLYEIGIQRRDARKRLAWLLVGVTAIIGACSQSAYAQRGTYVEMKPFRSGSPTVVWEYKFVELYYCTLNVIIKEGLDGWEFCGMIEDFSRNLMVKTNQTIPVITKVCVFKRKK